MASLNKRRTEAGVRRYDIRYRTPSGGVRTRTFRTLRDAERFAATVEADKLRGAWVDPRDASRTLADIAGEWIKSNPSKRPSTRATDTSHLDMHILPALGSRAVGRITRRDVQTAVNQWSGVLAPRTVRRVFGTLNAILNYANECELIVRNPCRGVKLPSARRVERRLPSVEQLADLTAELGDDFGIMVYLGAVLGLRWGECAGLRVGRIDFIRSTLTVAEQITRGSHGEPKNGPPKSSAGNRTLSMPSSLVAMLAAHLTRRGVTGANSDAFLLTMPAGGPLVYQNWRIRFWLPACKQIGLDGLGFHDLRRLNATGLVMAGVDVKTVQARLGHSDPRLTLAVYAQATTEADRAAADLLGDRFMTVHNPTADADAGGETK